MEDTSVYLAEKLNLVYYIKKGSAGYKSIGAESVRILAQSIVYYPNRN